MDIREPQVTNTIYKLASFTGSILGSTCASILEQTTKVASIGIGIVREVNSAFIAEVSPVYKQSKETIKKEFSNIAK
jgi:hypothetical protein